MTGILHQRIAHMGFLQYRLISEADAHGHEWIDGGLWLMVKYKASVCKQRDLKDKYSRGLQSSCNYTGPGLVTSPSTELLLPCTVNSFLKWLKHTLWSYVEFDTGIKSLPALEKCVFIWAGIYYTSKLSDLNS